MGSEVKRTFGALGRGDLLFFDPNDLVLVTDEKHPLYDERVNLPPNEHTILSIMALGVMEPIIVRKNGEDENGKPIVEVVDGRQRVRCTRIANERLLDAGKEPVRVPAITKRGDDTNMLATMIATNEVRTKDGPLVRARKMQRYLDLGRDVEETAIVCGCTVATVKNHMLLLELHPDVQEQIEHGKIGVTLAKRLAAFPREEQPNQLLAIVNKSTSSVNGSNGTAHKSTSNNTDAPTNGAAATAAADEQDEIEHVPLAGHTAEVSVPIKPSRAAATKKALKEALGKRGKVRQRSVKTAAQLKEARENLAGARSDVSAVADAVLAWALGEEDALSGYKVLENRLGSVK